MVSGTAQVLIVDDDAGIQHLVRTLLGRARLTCDVAPDGAEALLRIAKAPPDVVLLDLMLPKVDGFEVLAQLRERHPDVLRKVIVMTAASNKVMEQLTAYRDEICDVLRKPFDIDELMVSIATCVTPQKAWREPAS